MGKSTTFQYIGLLKKTAISTKSSHIEESQLVSRIKSRDQAAFEYLYDNYSGALYGVILRILKNEAIAEEVLHDSFLKIWDKIDQYDVSRGKLFTWIVNLARHLAIDKVRSKEIGKGNKTSSIDSLVHTIDLQDSVEQKTDSIGLKEVLKVLTEEQKFVVEFLYFKGYSQSELAEDFNIPLGTIKTRLRTALQKLRSTFH